jgi:hypothetical protein
MGRLLCWLRGHGPFYQRVLPESASLRYFDGPRDDAGRALSWPTCSRCGWMVVTMRIVE